MVSWYLVLYPLFFDSITFIGVKILYLNIFLVIFGFFRTQYFEKQGFKGACMKDNYFLKFYPTYINVASVIGLLKSLTIKQDDILCYLKNYFND